MTTTPTPDPQDVAQTATLMRVFRVCWLLLMLGFLYAAFPSNALAADSKCNTTSSGSLTMGNVSVPVGAANGTALGSPVPLTMVFNCTDVPTGASGNNLYVQAGNLAARIAPDSGTNGILFDTGIAGIALRIMGSPEPATSGSCLRCGPGSTAGFEIGPLTRSCSWVWQGWNLVQVCTATISQTFTAQFVKVGPVTPGILQGRQLMQFSWYEFGTTASSGPMGTALTVNGGAQVGTVGCSVDIGSQNMTVTMPNVSTSALPTPGSTAGITFATNNASSNSNGVIAPTSGQGMANNVGIQLLNGTATAPVPFNVAQSLGSTPNGAWSLPYHVQYYRTGNGQVGSGDVKGTLTFTMTYQ